MPLRDGLKAQEVQDLVRWTKAEMEEGADAEVAYRLACKGLVGIEARTFAVWKPDIFKLIEGKPTPANHMFSTADAAPVREKGFPGTTKRLNDLANENKELEKSHEIVLKENEELKKAKGLKDAEKSELEKLRAEVAELKKSKPNPLG